MQPTNAPRPTAELVNAAAELSAKQREVFQELQSRPQGAQISELATALTMHANTVRGHLDELMNMGVVSRRVVPNPGRGRPSHLYAARVPYTVKASAALIALVEALANTLTEEDENRARQLGKEWSRRAVGLFASFPQGNLPELARASVDTLREIGFDPELRDESCGPDVMEIGLKACPFITQEGVIPSPIVCAMHQGFVGAELEGHTVEIMPFDRPGQCGVRIHATEKERGV